MNFRSVLATLLACWPMFLQAKVAASSLPRICFGILAYQKPTQSVKEIEHQFHRMFNAILHEEHFYAVHVDSKSDAEFIDGVVRDWSSAENVRVLNSVSVSWAGITVVERTLATMQTCLENFREWDFFVNVGHEDYPLLSMTDMQAWLDEYPRQTNFMKCWDVREHSFFGQVEYHERRVQQVFVDDFRGRVHEAHEEVTRKNSEFKFFKSMQQMILSRDFASHAVYSIDARRLLLYSANTKAPDELFFPTLLMQSPRHKATATCDQTGHYSYWIRPGGSWHPEYLDLRHLSQILDADALFMRKVDMSGASKDIVEAVDALRAGSDIDGAWLALVGYFFLKDKLPTLRDFGEHAVKNAKIEIENAEEFVKSRVLEPVAQERQISTIDVLEALDAFRQAHHAVASEASLLLVADWLKSNSPKLPEAEIRRRVDRLREGPLKS